MDIKVVGTSFIPIDVQTIQKEMISTDGTITRFSVSLLLQPEPTNIYDPKAVKVIAKAIDGQALPIGYLPRSYVDEHPITSLTSCTGILTDFSNGKLKNVAYTLTL